MDTTVSSPLRVAKLLMVTRANNNKFYDMEEAADGCFTVRYGRVGTAGATATYPMAQWTSKYHEKLRKGYRDVTSLYVREEARPRATAADPAVQGLLDELLGFAQQAIYTHYMVPAEGVTPQQVVRAQTLLDELAAMTRLDTPAEAFDSRLLELYTVIPRKMKAVQDHLVGALDTHEAVLDAAALLEAEQALLDVMAGQVKHNVQNREEEGTPPSLLEAMGLAIRPADGAETEQIREQMGDEAGAFRRAFSVTNRRTQRLFEEAVSSRKDRTTALLWHGSRNENWLSILETGLVRHPASAVLTGKMFGYGLYFADRCRKSLGYTSLLGSCWAGGQHAKAYLALYDVHLGRQLRLRRCEPWCSTLTEVGLVRRVGLRRRRYDSVFAEGGVDLINNEYVIYNEAQCTIRYLVEVGH